MWELLRPPPDTPITVPVTFMEHWPRELLRGLQEATKHSLTRQPGNAISKDLYVDSGKKHAYLILNNPNNPVIMRQVQSQVEFYAQHAHDRIFTAVVVPMTARLVMNYGDQHITVGMRQDYYGTPVTEFIGRHGKITEEQIDTFAQQYRALIDHTGVAHGDLFTGFGDVPSVLWEQIRYGNKGLKFVDYNGQGGNITMGLSRYAQGTPAYQALSGQEPDALRSAMHRIFIG